MKPIFQPRKSVFLIDVMEKNMTAQELDRQNAEMEYTVPCRKNVAFSYAEAKSRAGKPLGKGAYVHKNQRLFLDELIRQDLIQHWQETEDGNFSVTLKEAAEFIAIPSTTPLDAIVQDVRDRTEGKEARVCFCGEKDCEADPHKEAQRINAKRMIDWLNKHTHNMGPGPSEPPQRVLAATIVETTVPRTGELHEVEESFAMNFYKFWTSSCRTDQLFDEVMEWDELPEDMRDNFVQALRTQVLMPIQTYINQIAKDRDLATGLLAKKVQQTAAPNRDSGVAGSGFCYVCSRNPATNGRLCVACHRSLKRS